MIYFSIGRAQRILMVRFAVMLAALGAFSAMGVKLVPYLTRPDGLKWPDKAASTMTNALGLTCTVLNVGMYAAPLAAVGTVIKKRSVQSMPLSLTLCTGFCSMCWTYARPAHLRACVRAVPCTLHDLAALCVCLAQHLCSPRRR